jgi:antitoxin ChpS
MATVTLSSKHQVTLPVDMVRSLGLKAGDKLVAELIDDRIVLLPKPESWTNYFTGSLKGVYGDTKEEIDRYIAEIRYGWDIDALKDALSLDSELRAVYEATSFKEAYSLGHIRKTSKVRLADQKLQQLEELSAVKVLVHPTNKAEPYFRRIPER